MMIRYILNKLEADSRKQVPVNVLEELNSAVVDITMKLMDAPTSDILRKLRALQEALATISVTPGTMFLTDRMKVVLVEGFRDLAVEIRLVTFEHFKTNDFEPTDTVVSLMREVVETAAQRGVI